MIKKFLSQRALEKKILALQPGEFLRDAQFITFWLDSKHIQDYTLVPDDTYGFVVDVGGLGVDISNNDLKRIPIKFNIVDADFYCSHNLLYNLLGAPNIVNGVFSCTGNQLTDLEGGPEHVSSSYFCTQNKLISLAGAPTSLGGIFNCNSNPYLGQMEGVRTIEQVRAVLEKDLLGSTMVLARAAAPHKI